MLNEFIAWDKNNKRFVTFGSGSRYLGEGKTAENFCMPTFSTKDDGKTFIQESKFYYAEDWDIEWFPYIGKTDDTPEKNKIYADCSVVEFVYRNKNCKAVIRWDSIQLCYDVAFENGWRVRYSDVYQELFGLKVIGTLQENPELLGEK